MNVPYSVENERAVLGAMLLAPSVVRTFLVEERVEPAHFYVPSHRSMMAAMVGLADRGESVDVVSVVAEAKRQGTTLQAADVDAVTADVPTVDGMRGYARRVIELAGFRAKQAAAQHLLAAIEAEDQDGIANAEAMLTAPDSGTASDTTSPEQLAHRIFEYLQAPGAPGIPTGLGPFDRLIGGGLRPGDTTTIAAWTAMGKSVLVNGILTHAARHGRRVHLYSNEMSDVDTGLRLVAMDGAARYSDLMLREVPEDAHAKVMRALKDLPFDMTNIANWSYLQVARHIRSQRFDLCAIDLLHNMPYRDVRELDLIISTLTNAARSVGTHLILVGQFNDERAKNELLPFPVLRDLRGSAMLRNACRNVLLLHREQEHEEGAVVTRNEAVVYAAKATHGRTGARVRLLFDPDRMRLLPLERPMEAA